MNLPNPHTIVYTQGVLSLKGIGFKNPKEDYVFGRALELAVFDAYRNQPDECFDGGNDKSFFTLQFRGEKLFACANEIGGLTIMFPSEY